LSGKGRFPETNLKKPAVVDSLVRGYFNFNLDLKRKRLMEAIAIMKLGDGDPPYQCHDCLALYHTPHEFLDHLGDDHFVVSEQNKDTFLPNESK
jgi:hypothetical protein